MALQRNGPTRIGYLISVVVFGIGIIGGIALVVVFALGIIRLGSDLERVVVPGSQELELSETGTYTIFYEYESTVGGVDYSTGSTPPNLRIEIERVDDGADIPVRSAGFSTNYDLWDRAGESIRRFDVDRPGTYLITAEYADGSDGEEIVLAIGEGVGRGILTSVGAFLGAGFLFCAMTLLAIGIAGVTFFRRYQWDREHPATASSR